MSSETPKRNSNVVSRRKYEDLGREFDKVNDQRDTARKQKSDILDYLSENIPIVPDSGMPFHNKYLGELEAVKVRLERYKKDVVDNEERLCNRIIQLSDENRSLKTEKRRHAELFMKTVSSLSDSLLPSEEENDCPIHNW